ncbi:hypothetical protein FGO68_gene9600 [Halteria grandinella]|uniref:Uncharacterized protein n=1 Tax=Halteria grandinella TaxID=5974 RepID=A0A8J8T7A9_HALGN|nr:hypothetical protein FGO68_gene9600 [Halteria grandinella]
MRWKVRLIHYSTRNYISLKLYISSLQILFLNGISIIHILQHCSQFKWRKLQIAQYVITDLIAGQSDRLQLAHYPYYSKLLKLESRKHHALTFQFGPAKALYSQHPFRFTAYSTLIHSNSNYCFGKLQRMHKNEELCKRRNSQKWSCPYM